MGELTHQNGFWNSSSSVRLMMQQFYVAQGNKRWAKKIHVAFRRSGQFHQATETSGSISTFTLQAKVAQIWLSICGQYQIFYDSLNSRNQIFFKSDSFSYLALDQIRIWSFAMWPQGWFIRCPFWRCREHSEALHQGLTCVMQFCAETTGGSVFWKVNSLKNHDICQLFSIWAACVAYPGHSEQ